MLVDQSESPFDNFAHEEIRARVEEELRQVPEPFRTAIVLRDLEELSYEEIAEITQVTLGTVKSRVTRGRQALRKRLAPYIQEVGPQRGLETADELEPVIEESTMKVRARVSLRGRGIEVTP